jgi:hypothetical protein
MGAIILQGTHFLAPRSTMVTMPLTGTLEKSSANTICAAKDTIKATQQASSLILKNFMLDLSFFVFNPQITQIAQIIMNVRWLPGHLPG